MITIVITNIVLPISTWTTEQNGRHFADDILKCIILNENLYIFIKISLKFIPKGQIDNKSTLVKEMAWHLTGAKPLSELMMIQSATCFHSCGWHPISTGFASFHSQSFADNS